MPLGLEALTRAVTKRAQRGLYASRKVLAGNNISDDGGNKTRRVWNPNVQNKRLWSGILGRMVPLRVTTAALRNIDKAGGLDEYILGTSEEKLDSEAGLQLKAELLQRLDKLGRRQLQREPGGAPSFAAQGAAPAVRQQAPDAS
eukprot:scaffold15.g4307.t1